MKTRRKEILGDILRRERVIRRISQETLGNVVGLGKTAISAYELGKASPPKRAYTNTDRRCCSTVNNVQTIKKDRMHYTSGLFVCGYLCRLPKHRYPCSEGN